ncbi:MAG TPA: hypothetical protein ENG87_04645 [Candidatus Pacearchaeota archaeon]|nr:hypothetical protein BMS3Abin17_00347 [archaeon BMS3Abin17]HDK42645.1 hypothetical protein [Candidatus Pacearchaeota archaeon]HDZ60857.1 hypothetical protein [Candidatus Pacearchaeota archaeon]
MVKANHKELRYAALARSLYNSKESKIFANGSLYRLAEELGLDPQRVRGFVKGATATDESTKATIDDYSEQFDEQFGNLNVSDLPNQWYEPALRGLSNDAQDKIKKVFEAHEGVTFKELNDILGKANYILYPESKKYGDHTDKEREDAENTLRKYDKINKIMTLLELYTLESLRPKAVNVTRKKSLEAIVKAL